MNTVERMLLLGGAGFMGRALAKRLSTAGCDVHVLVRGSLMDAPDGVTAHGGGMENTELLRALLPDMDAIVHLASATTPGLSRAAPSLEAELNIAPTLGVLEELQRHPQVKLIYLSSGGTVYGNPGQPSAAETTPTQSLSYYGAGKLAIEEFLHCFQRLAGNPVAILRPSNIYGPGQPRYQGFGVIRTMLQHLLDGTTMEIWGDGTVVRDFIYIDDVVAAIEKVLAHPKPSGIFNVGSDVGHSLNELVKVVEDVTGKRLAVRHEPSRNIDVQRIVLDSTAMQDHFGWRVNTSLDVGIGSTWDWLRSQ